MAIRAEERYWIEAGQLVASPPILDENPATVDERLHRLGHVRIIVGPLGTEIKWSTFAPCHSSLFAAMEWLSLAKAPVILRFYWSGWFEETNLTADQARARIERVMQRSDRRLDKRTFVYKKIPVVTQFPPLIRKCWLEGMPSPEHAVDCIYHEESDQYFVERIGHKSALAKYFGLSTASFPCQSGSFFGTEVSHAYREANAKNTTVYDQVLASLPLAPHTFHWLAYHRLIFPALRDDGQMRVSVIVDVAPVEIQVI